MKLNRPAIWVSFGIFVAVVGFILGGLDDLKHTGAFKTWNSVGNMLFWVGLVILAISATRCLAQRCERRKQPTRPE